MQSLVYSSSKQRPSSFDDSDDDFLVKMWLFAPTIRWIIGIIIVLCLFALKWDFTKPKKKLPDDKSHWRLN